MTKPIPQLQLEPKKESPTHIPHYRFPALRRGPCEHFSLEHVLLKLAHRGRSRETTGERLASFGLGFWRVCSVCGKRCCSALLCACLEGSYSMTLQSWQRAQEPLLSGPPEALGALQPCTGSVGQTPLAHLASTLTLPVSQKTFCCSVPGTQLGSSSAILGVTATPFPGVSIWHLSRGERALSKFALPWAFLSQFSSHLGSCFY